MGWSEVGDDRVRRFKLYRELEARYLELQSDRKELEDVVANKDELIRRLAEQLAQVQTAVDVMKSETLALKERTAEGLYGTSKKADSRPPPKISGTMTLAEVLAGVEGKRQQR